MSDTKDALADPREFLGYVDAHSRTPRALFHGSHILRAFEMAALPCPITEAHREGFFAWHYMDAREVLEAARGRLESPQ